MEPFDAQLAAMAALTTGLGAMMVWLAGRVNALELRQPRRCASCGVRKRTRCRCYR